MKAKHVRCKLGLGMWKHGRMKTYAGRLRAATNCAFRDTTGFDMACIRNLLLSIPNRHWGSLLSVVGHIIRERFLSFAGGDSARMLNDGKLPSIVRRRRCSIDLIKSLAKKLISGYVKFVFRHHRLALLNLRQINMGVLCSLNRGRKYMIRRTSAEQLIFILGVRL